MNLSIIAVLLGRFRLTVAEAIENFKSIWRHMAAETTLAQKALPGWKNKAASSRHLDEAFTQVIETNLKSSKCARLKVDTTQRDLKDQFAMNADLCRT